MTIGERADDVFYITDELGRQLPEKTRLRPEEQLHASLDLRDAAKIA
jgi:UTP:GlnB (protein PII) uridylyltransferase